MNSENIILHPDTNCKWFYFFIMCPMEIVEVTVINVYIIVKILKIYIRLWCVCVRVCVCSASFLRTKNTTVFQDFWIEVINIWNILFDHFFRNRNDAIFMLVEKLKPWHRHKTSITIRSLIRALTASWVSMKQTTVRCQTMIWTWKKFFRLTKMTTPWKVVTMSTVSTTRVPWLVTVKQCRRLTNQRLLPVLHQDRQVCRLIFISRSHSMQCAFLISHWPVGHRPICPNYCARSAAFPRGPFILHFVAIQTRQSAHFGDSFLYSCSALWSKLPAELLILHNLYTNKIHDLFV